MTFNVNFHSPEVVEAHAYSDYGSLVLRAGEGTIIVYTAPEIATAMAGAFNGTATPLERKLRAIVADYQTALINGRLTVHAAMERIEDALGMPMPVITQAKPEDDGWLPIESVPENVDVWLGIWDGKTVAGERILRREGERFYTSSDFMVWGWKPTHWKPVVDGEVGL